MSTRRRTIEEQLQQAKALIQQKRYDDARAVLITVDHPTADVWLNRLNQMGTGAVQTGSERSFTAKLFLTILLLFLGGIPGIIALAIFAPEAKRHPDAPGARGLITLNRFMFVLIILVPIVLLGFVVLVLLRLG